MASVSPSAISAETDSSPVVTHVPPSVPSSPVNFSRLTHPSFSISNIKNSVSEILTFTNYLLWKSLFIPIFRGYGVLDHIDGTGVCPPPTITDSDGNTLSNPDHILWIQVDNLVLSWIQATVSTDILRSFLKPNVSLTAREAWVAIEQLFHDQAHARLLQLKTEFSTTNKNDLSIDSYLQKLKSIYDALCSIGHPLTESDLVMQVLEDLSHDYEAVVVQMAARVPLPTFVELRTALYLHELRLARHSKVVSSQSNTAFVVQSRPSVSSPSSGQPVFSLHPPRPQQFYPPRGRGGRGRGGRNNFHPRPFNPNYFSRPFYSPPRPSLSIYPPQHTAAPGLLGQRPYVPFFPQPPSFPSQCQICLDPHHSARDCPTRFLSFSPRPVIPQDNFSRSFAALNLHDPPEPAWLPDTGAASHMTNNPGILCSPIPYSGFNKVMFGDGSLHPITHVGTSYISTPSKNFCLNDVLVVPSLTNDLLSVKRFTRDNNCSIEFTLFDFRVKDLQTRMPLLQSICLGDLYSFKPSSVGANSIPC